MRLAAMYSGGKDSTMAMYTAVQMGHNISCIVTIKPTDKASWIFHTPNLDVVPLIAESMGVEHISIESDGTEAGDMDSMRDVLSKLDIDGIVVGALWSDYQWDRMNYVCGELNLKVIAPLWRKNQDLIYDEMVSAGVVAIIAGVFAEGLNEKWLGKTLDNETKIQLMKLREKYGISIMGEGGEYESLTIDSPMHSKKLLIEKSENVMERDAGVMYITEASLSNH